MHVITETLPYFLNECIKYVHLKYEEIKPENQLVNEVIKEGI